MKSAIFTFIGVLYSIFVFAQIKKVYLDSEFKYTKNLKNATSYVLIEKQTDSLYAVRQFTIRDTAIMDGFYRDDKLSIPIGKFIYYGYHRASKKVKYSYDNNTLDTNKSASIDYIKTVGFYVNGSKTGRWIEFDSNHSIRRVNSFNKGKEDGVSLYYFENGQIEYSYLFDKGKLSGPNYHISFKGDTISKSYVEKGRSINISYSNAEKFKIHVKPGYPPFDMDSFVEDRLSKSEKSEIFNGYHGVYSFTLTKEGKLSDAVIENVCDLTIDKHIVKIFINDLVWTPTCLDKIPVESKIKIILGSANQNHFRVPMYVKVSGIKVLGYNGYYENYTDGYYDKD